jgi:hypothetical protein
MLFEKFKMDEDEVLVNAYDFVYFFSTPVAESTIQRAPGNYSLDET